MLVLKRTKITELSRAKKNHQKTPKTKQTNKKPQSGLNWDGLGSFLSNSDVNNHVLERTWRD